MPWTNKQTIIRNTWGGGSGDVVWPTSSTDTALVRFDSTTGKIIQNGIITETDTGELDNVNWVQFDTTPTALTPTEGLLQWNVDENTLNLWMSWGDVTQQIGQETFIYAKNQTGSTLTNGKVAMFAGAVWASGRVKVQYGIANWTLLSEYTMWIFTEDIADWTDGFVTTFGKVRWVDTTGTPYGETWAEWDILYLSPTTAGSLTKVKPQAPNLQITVCAVVNVHAVNGVLFVRPTWKTKFTDLDDVNGTPLTTTGQIAVWDQTNWYFDFTSNVSDFASTSHTHSIANVTGLQTALDSKATPADISTAISNLVDTAPWTLDTLNELANALWDDPNFSTTVTTSLWNKVDKNTTIVWSTKTKITYDAKGLVTAWADATTADIADSTNKRYVSDAQLTVIGNTSGTNTGDNAVNSLYSWLSTSKQNADAWLTSISALTWVWYVKETATDTFSLVSTIPNTDITWLGTLSTQSGTFSGTHSGTSSGTNTGDQTSIVGITGTKAQFDTAVTDGDFMYVGDAPTAHTHLLANITDVTMTVANLNSLDDGVNSTLHFHDTDRARANHTGTQLSSTISDFTEASQDAVGAMIDTTLVYVDGTPLLTRSALTGAITASQGSNATALGSFTTAQLNTALSDNDVATGGGTATGTNTGDQSLFSTIAVSGQSNVVADSTSDTLTLVAGTNITITTNATTDEITINATGGWSLTTQDEGVTLSTSVTTLNFTGAGVTASGAGATATINIPWGWGGSATPYEMLRQTQFLPF